MNYEDLVPIINDCHRWEVTPEQHVVVFRKKKGIGQREKMVELELDDYGTYVWKKIDGKRSNRDIIQEIQLELGEELEFAKQRLILFMHMLKKYELIRYVVSVHT